MLFLNTDPRVVLSRAQLYFLCGCTEALNDLAQFVMVNGGGELFDRSSLGTIVYAAYS